MVDGGEESDFAVIDLAVQDVMELFEVFFRMELILIVSFALSSFC